jgi:hypothetical protein
MFLIIARAIAAPVFFEVDGCDHFCFEVALGKDDPYALIVAGYAFQRIGRAWPVIDITFIVIDLSVAHDVFYFGLGNLAALHAAFGMSRILEIRNAAVKSAVAVDGCRVSGSPAGIGRIGFWLCRLGLLQTPDDE